MEYDWEKIVKECCGKGRGPFLTYPGDNGSEDETTRMLKAADYADWVYAKAERAAMRSMIEMRPKKRHWWAALRRPW